MVICALAVATTTSVFSAVDGILFRAPSGVEHPAELFRLYRGITVPPQGETVSRAFSYPQFIAIQGRLSTTADVAAVSGHSVSVGLGTSARAVMAGFVTSEFFRLAGVRMVRGRGFSAEDVRAPAGNAVVIISARYWRGVLGRRPDVLGLPIIVAGKTYSIIGVAPPSFQGIYGPPVDIWLPLSAAGLMFHGEVWDFSGGDYWVEIIGRYRGAAAGTQVMALASQALDPSAGRTGAVSSTGRVRALVGPIQLALGPGRSLQARVSLWLLWIAVAVLVVSCANIANLYVVRFAARRRDLALRMALGASVWSLFRRLLIETSVLSGLGGMLGIVIASLANTALRSLVSQGPTVAPPRIDLRVVVVAMVSTAVVAFLSAMLPLVGVWRTDLTVCTKEGGSQATHRRSPLRSSLATMQVALATLLLVASGLFLHTLHAVFTIDLGMEPDRVLVVRADLASAGHSQREIDTFYRTALNRMRRLPAIASASIGATVPFHSGVAVYTAAPGAPHLSASGADLAYINVVTPDFFRTLGMRIIHGRAFTADDRAGSLHVAVVSRALANVFWPGADAVGKCMHVGSPTAPCTRVVGVAADAARDQPTESAALQYFLPLAQQDSLVHMRALFLRTRVPPSTTVGDVRRAIEMLAPDIPYPSVTPLEQFIEPYVQPWRTAASLLTIFAVIAVVMAVHGLQSVIAFAVVERRQELAVRLALGGTPGDILRLVAREGLRLSTVGIAFGLGAAALAAPKMSPLLFGTSAFEPVVYMVAGAVLLASGLLASVLPGVRAAVIRPAEVLRR